ncbi:TRAP transporter substrate-binding protein DctP [bacterium]|nr:TRAP transporter substrate-binding protein DctP [bacterium]MCB9477881.1 TRAP transporter substrate-binding protein DctP [Deltaproteobacteria bacterium]
MPRIYRRFSIVAAAALVLVFSAAAQAATLKLATLLPENTELVTSLKRAEERIQKETNGRVNFKIYPGGVMGQDSTVFQKMKIGQLHGGTFTAGGASEVAANFQILSLPLQFRNYDEVDYVRRTMDPIILKQLEAKGYHPITVMEVGFAYLMSDKPVSSIDEMRRQKTWIPEYDPVGKAVFEILGTPPVTLALSNVLTSLQTGQIDAYFNSPVGAVTLQWYTRVNYMMELPLVYTYGTFILSDKAVKSLGDDWPVVKKILFEELEAVQKGNRKANAEAIETLKKQGIKVLPVSDGETKNLEELGRKAVARVQEKNLFTPSMVDQVYKLIEEYRAKKGN